MNDRPLDRVRDLPWLFGLWLLDKLAGPEPETETDRINARIREAHREQLTHAFPGLFRETNLRTEYGPIVPIAGEWYVGVRCWRCGEMVAMLPDASRGQGPVAYPGLALADTPSPLRARAFAAVPAPRDAPLSMGLSELRTKRLELTPPTPAQR